MPQANSWPRNVGYLSGETRLGSAGQEKPGQASTGRADAAGADCRGKGAACGRVRTVGPGGDCKDQRKLAWRQRSKAWERMSVPGQSMFRAWVTTERLGSTAVSHLGLFCVVPSPSVIVLLALPKGCARRV